MTHARGKVLGIDSQCLIYPDPTAEVLAQWNVFTLALACALKGI